MADVLATASSDEMEASAPKAGDKRDATGKSAPSAKKIPPFPEEPDFLSELTKSRNKSVTFTALLDRVTRPGCGKTVITISAHELTPEPEGSDDEEEPLKHFDTAEISCDMCLHGVALAGPDLYRLLGRESVRDSAQHVANAVSYLKAAYAVTKSSLPRIDKRKETKRLEDDVRELEERLAVSKAALAARKRHRSDEPSGEGAAAE